MDIAKILEYQKLDFVIYKADRDYANSEENKRSTKLRMARSEVAESLVRLDKETADIYSDIERLKGVLDNFIKKTKTTPLSGAKTLDQAEKLEESISDLENELNGLDKELQKSFKRLQDISKEAAELRQKLIRLSNELKSADALRTQKRQEIINSISAEGKKLSDMKLTIAPEDLAVYMKARTAKVKMPIVVEYKDGHCGACGMEIKSEVDAKLQNPGDIAECPNCRRVVYKK